MADSRHPSVGIPAASDMHSGPERLGDFTMTPRVLPIAALAIVIGTISAFFALGLLRLINFFTNVFYYGRWSSTPASSVGNHLGYYAVLVPIVGSLIVAVMARCSERIRGHGIPETIEAILINGSRIEPKVALLKPVANFAAIPAQLPLRDIAQSIRMDHWRSQRILPVVDPQGKLLGILARSDLRKFLENPEEGALARPIGEMARRDTVEAYPNETLRLVVNRMAEKGVTRMPVVAADGSRKLLGLISLDDLLKARVRNLEEERRREIVLPLHMVFPPRIRRPAPPGVQR